MSKDVGLEDLMEKTKKPNWHKSFEMPLIRIEVAPFDIEINKEVLFFKPKGGTRI